MSNLPSQIRSPEDAGILKILSGPHKGKQFRLLGLEISIGQSSDCDIILKNNKSCSQNHALITYDNENQYMIKSLDSANPIIINKKPVSHHKLVEKDVITIGTSQFLFLNKKSLPSPRSFEYEKHQQEAALLKQKTSKNSVRIIFIFFICLSLGYLLLNKEIKKEQAQKGLKIQEEIQDEIEATNSPKEEIVEENLTVEQEAARVAFIKGFRDYRKGYYHRALKFFEQCTTIQKNHKLCLSYARKSKVLLEKIIQKKIILGKIYKENRQYEACEAAFKSIEIMVQDSSSPVYKEAKKTRKLCQLKTKNRI